MNWEKLDKEIKSGFSSRKQAKYCGETIRTIYHYISTSATACELSKNYNISEDYLKEIFGYFEHLLLENEDNG